MQAKGNGALWVGGFVFGIIGGLAAMLFLVSGLALSRQVMGVLWSVGLLLTGAASCRMADGQSLTGA